MSAYIIAHMQVSNPQQYEQYKTLAKVASEKYGGEYLARGGELEVLEGDWHPPRVVIVKYPSMAKARAFYDSPEYREARNAREGAAVMSMVLVEGL
ncbi:MAG: DUF1330 domain-containing protein [Rubrivivax sp.]